MRARQRTVDDEDKVDDRQVAARRALFGVAVDHAIPKSHTNGAAMSQRVATLPLGAPVAIRPRQVGLRERAAAQQRTAAPKQQIVRKHRWI